MARPLFLVLAQLAIGLTDVCNELCFSLSYYDYCRPAGCMNFWISSSAFGVRVYIQNLGLRCRCHSMIDSIDCSTSDY